MASTATPTRKVATGTFAGALTIILVWIAGLLGLEVPPEVASAVTVLITAGVAYLVPDKTSPGKYEVGQPLRAHPDETHGNS